jgi:hypothetical protein
MSRPTRFLLVVFAAALAACDRTPAAVTTADADAVAAEAAVVDAILSPQGDPGALAPGGSLAALFNQAIEKATKDQGRDAAAKLGAPVRELLSQAERAARAGDQATAAARLAAARTESIRVIVLVLGHDPIAAFLTDQGRRADELRARIETAAKAGQDVTRAQAILAQIDAGLKTAATALTAGNLAGALDAASAAVDLFPSLLRALTPPPAAPPVTPPSTAAPGWSVTALFAQAIAAVSHDRGEAAAREIRSKLEQLNKDADAATRAGDSATAQKKLAEARALTLQTIVDALGRSAVEGAIKAVDTGLADLRARITSAATAGKDVKSATEAADRAAALLAQSRDALAKGQLTTALDLASQGGEWITEGRGRVERAS